MEKLLLDTLISWRRHLHAHPELTLREKETSLFVQSKLRELGVPFVAGVGGHGVVATLTRGSSNRSVGLRADMDALPIAETSGVPHSSTNPGVMHACGHDGHTTSLLGAAALLSQDTAWSGTVQFVFQPAEEGGGGAKSMIADGLFERFPMERIFGYHNWPGLFVLTAWIANALGIGSVGLAEAVRFAPPTLNLLFLTALISIYRRFTGDPRLVWASAWVFIVGNWVGQDYTSGHSD